MSNLGFVHAMEAAGIDVEQTKVGDRYVLEAMRAGNFFLGGEQSGHVVLLDHATTGDGVLTGLHLMNRMAATGQYAGRAGRGDDPAAAGAGERARRGQVAGRLRPGSRGGRARTRHANSAIPVGSCCDRPAPSRWSG